MDQALKTMIANMPEKTGKSLMRRFLENLAVYSDKKQTIDDSKSWTQG